MSQSFAKIRPGPLHARFYTQIQLEAISTLVDLQLKNIKDRMESGFPRYITNQPGFVVMNNWHFIV